MIWLKLPLNYVLEPTEIETLFDLVEIAVEFNVSVLAPIVIETFLDLVEIALNSVLVPTFAAVAFILPNHLMTAAFAPTISPVEGSRAIPE